MSVRESRLHRSVALRRRAHFLITCEHGGNHVPPRYANLFRSHTALLHTHRGYDAGALDIARHLAKALDAPLFASTVTRLLVDLNRSIGHPRLYSEVTRDTPNEVRREILARHYTPHRDRIEAWIAEVVQDGGWVIHIACHSFTPVLDGKRRDADLSLLYDPARSDETALCKRWQRLLQLRAPQVKIRRNYPYRGADDGLSAYLRRHFDQTAYLGIELEINQKHIAIPERWRTLCHVIVDALLELRGTGRRFTPISTGSGKRALQCQRNTFPPPNRCR